MRLRERERCFSYINFYLIYYNYYKINILSVVILYMLNKILYLIYIILEEFEKCCFFLFFFLFSFSFKNFIYLIIFPKVKNLKEKYDLKVEKEIMI
jgi:hypothetical protein